MNIEGRGNDPGSARLSRQDKSLVGISGCGRPAALQKVGALSRYKGLKESHNVNGYTIRQIYAVLK